MSKRTMSMGRQSKDVRLFVHAVDWPTILQEIAWKEGALEEHQWTIVRREVLVEDYPMVNACEWLAAVGGPW